MQTTPTLQVLTPFLWIVVTDPVTVLATLEAMKVAVKYAWLQVQVWRG